MVLAFITKEGICSECYGDKHVIEISSGPRWEPEEKRFRICEECIERFQQTGSATPPWKEKFRNKYGRNPTLEEAKSLRSGAVKYEEI